MNKVVIVTGGSRGIGAATSLLLAQQGYRVCVNYRTRQQDAEAIVSQIDQAGGIALSYQADVTDPNQVDQLFNRTREIFGEVTHLVNNAGILFPQSQLKDISLERFQTMMNGNLMSCFLCCKTFIHQNTLGGAIVNVSSIAARTGSPFEYVDYAATKGAMDSLTKGLSLELTKGNIRVNAVRPGFIHTDIHAAGGEPNRVEWLAPQIPMKRGGNPAEVAQSIAWLLSDEASYVTGSFVDIAGGR